ncbi:MAG: bifunctional DNA-formamidopyrimidine glycosylase/DNA-(apurinic or apyrimidinic site) lyase [Capsulimonadales bacterium]|nr:bifunctional DNA-formamidopyrimidine glycosylase/DNA-(apurinic or apyrimidinic site) lyase [Capsulimonadales bacterium]
MPELPEVETLRRGLEIEVTGRRILGTVVANAKVLKEQTEAAFRERIVGRWIQQIDRRGKYLLLLLGDADPRANLSENGKTSVRDDRQHHDLPLASPLFLCIHLKMRGQLLLLPAETGLAPYHCVRIRLDDGRDLRFHDMWTWGEIRALTAEELAGVAGLAGMGPEPLSKDWSGAELRRRLAKRSGAVKSVLLDQRTVAGVGNIYADESLHRAGIHPERPARSLTETETERLAEAIRTVLTEAVNGGGTLSDEYTDLAGKPGRYSPRVYDRGGQPCGVCGTKLTRIRLGGRGTVYCSRCQPFSEMVG